MFIFECYHFVFIFEKVNNTLTMKRSTFHIGNIKKVFHNNRKFIKKGIN